MYDEPALYDILQTPGTAAEVDALQRVARRHGAPAGSWWEPACGTGRYLRVLTGRGVPCAGYDRDPGMVGYAARRLGDAVVRGEMTAARPPGAAAGSVAVAFNPVNSLRHLDDDDAVLAHLAQVAAALLPAGLYLVGISLADYDRLEPEEDLWEGARGRCRVSQLVNYLPPEPGTARDRIETVLSHLTITRPRGVEHRDGRYGLRSYDEVQWATLLARSALTRVASHDAFGLPLAGRSLPYQLEVLRRR